MIQYPFDLPGDAPSYSADYREDYSWVEGERRDGRDWAPVAFLIGLALVVLSLALIGSHGLGWWAL